MSLSFHQKKFIALASLGGALEFYDFVIFIYVASAIGKQFFPMDNPLWSFVAALALFAVSYMVRPIGGAIFGHMGDTQGRKRTFLLTLVFMVIPTFLMGLLPTYAQVGFWAPVGLVSLRIMQGLAVGGELPGAFIFGAEHAGDQRVATSSSIILVGIGLGVLLGEAVVFSVKSSLSAEDYLAWGWRIPFIIGGILGVLAIFLRRAMQETPAYLEVKQAQALTSAPFPLLLKEYTATLFLGVGVMALLAVQAYAFFIFMPTHLERLARLGIRFPYQDSYVMVLILIQLLLYPPMGWLVDKFGIVRMTRLGALGLGLSAWPIYYFLALNTLMTTLAAGVLTLVFTTITSVSGVSLLLLLYPTRIKYTGVAMSYNLSYALFGGLTPLLITLLVEWTANPAAPAAYIILMAGISLCSVMRLHRSSHLA